MDLQEKLSLSLLSDPLVIPGLGFQVCYHSFLHPIAYLIKETIFSIN